MPDPINYDELAAEIAAAVTQPQATTVDGVSVSNRPLGEQLDALKHLERRQAAKRFPLGQAIRVNRPDALG